MPVRCKANHDILHTDGRERFHFFCGIEVCCLSLYLQYTNDMEIVFDKQYLEELYLTGKTSDKKHRYQPHIIVKYRKTIDLLESVGRVEDLYRYHSLNYEVLVGDKAGLESVRVNDQYRIEFKTTQVMSEIVITVCNVIELSNHYK